MVSFFEISPVGFTRRSRVYRRDAIRFQGLDAILGGWKVRKHFLTRYTVKNGISNLYILLKSALKMQEMPFQRPKFQNISEEAYPRTPYNCRHYGLPLTKILATPLYM